MARHRTESERNMDFSPEMLANSSEYATMTLDSFGRIRSCCAWAEEIFAARRASLIGRPVSEIIEGLFRGRSSPSFGARYLVYLCADSEWHRFEATDKGGREFAVELSLLRTQVSGQEIFVLSLRRPEQSTRP